MRLPIVLSLIFLPTLLLANSTDRRYNVDHDRLINAALEAISEEAHVKLDSIVRTETEEKGGRITRLEAPYIYCPYSQIKVAVDSAGNCSCDLPNLKVQIATDTYLYTRHKQWELRIHELVAMKLRARKHGPETEPQALPPTPITPPSAVAPLPGAATPSPALPPKPN